MTSIGFGRQHYPPRFQRHTGRHFHIIYSMDQVLTSMQGSMNAEIEKFAQARGKTVQELTEEEFQQAVDAFADEFLSRMMKLFLQVQEVPKLTKFLSQNGAQEDFDENVCKNYNKISLRHLRPCEAAQRIFFLFSEYFKEFRIPVLFPSILGDPAKANGLCGERRSTGMGGVFRTGKRSVIRVASTWGQAERLAVRPAQKEIGQKPKPTPYQPFL